MTELHIPAEIVGIVGAIFSILLACIVYFLDRLIKQFDNLSGQFSTLNETMKKIDKDLSGDVGILKNENATMKEKLSDMSPLWERMRAVESDVIEIKSGGCSLVKVCKGQ